MDFIKYVSLEEAEKQIRRYNLESRLHRLEKRHLQSKKPTVMDELLTLIALHIPQPITHTVQKQ